MRRTLIAIAAAGALASGAAVAASTTVQLNHDTGYAGFVPVQYSSDRWDDRAASINDREAHIKARIDRGVNDGRITRIEARRLYRQLASIEAKERSYKSTFSCATRTGATRTTADRSLTHPAAFRRLHSC